MQIDPTRIKNILVVRNDKFGEFLLNIPALRALKETFTQAKIIVVVTPYVKELAESVPFIDEIIEWGAQKHSWIERIRMARYLKSKKIDIAIMLYPYKEFNIISYLSNIPVRVGYARKCGFLLTHKIKDKKYLGEKHEIEYNLELVSLVGAKTQDKNLSLEISDSQTSELLRDYNIGLTKDLIAIHPWTSDSIKEWPMHRFSELTARLMNSFENKIIIIGGKEEMAKSMEFCDKLDGKLVNLTGKTTLRQLAALLKRCKLLISADSGPVHLAYAVGTPVLVMFRNDIPGKSPRRWGPFTKTHVVVEQNNICNITAEEVFNKAKERLSI